MPGPLLLPSPIKRLTGDCDGNAVFSDILFLPLSGLAFPVPSAVLSPIAGSLLLRPHYVTGYSLYAKLDSLFYEWLHISRITNHKGEKKDFK
jgi:hypothetical protein